MRYIIGFLITIGLIVLVFVLIFKGFSGNGSTVTSKPLIDYANTNVQVQMTIDGPVNAEQTHNEVQMTVGSSQSILTLYNGYQGTVAQTKTYANNSASYAEFLRALDLYGFTKGEAGPNINSDPRGYCAFGDRYSFEILNGSSTIQNLWATSCGGQGTFKGSVPNIKSLFIAQMPDYDTVTSNANL